MNRSLLAFVCALALPTLTHAQDPTPPRIDDGSIRWVLSNNSEASGGPPYNVGWGMYVDFRMTGEPRADATILLRFRKGSQALGRLRCTSGGVSGGQLGYDCRDANLRIQTTGRIEVDAVWVDPDTDTETPLRTFVLNVATVGRMRNAETPDATQQYVDYHSEILSTVSLPGSARGADQVAFRFWMSPTEWGGGQFADSDLTFRCRVDGQPLPAANPNERARILLIQEEDPVVTGSRYEGAAVNPTTDPIRFVRMRLVAPIALNEDGHYSWTWLLSDHPGHWECDLKSDGETVRTFRFDAQGDHLLPHAEQANGLALGPGHTLVETVIPASSPRDFRTDPAAARTAGFFGRAWTTDSMRALAAAVPAIGSPRPAEPRVAGFGPNAPTELMARGAAPASSGGGGAARSGGRTRTSRGR